MSPRHAHPRARRTAGTTRALFAPRSALASLVVGTLVVGAGLLAAPLAASAATNAPMDALRGFTILTEGDLTTGGSAHEVEGSAAIGGDVIVDKSYILGTAHGGAALPTVGSEPIQLLVGGTLDINVSGEALKTNQGKARIGDTAGFAVNDGGTSPQATGKRLFNTATPNNVLFMSNDSTSVAAVTAPGLWASTFSGAFAQLRADSAAIGALGAPDATLLTLVQPSNFNGISGADRGIQLVANTINVLRVSEAELENGFQNLKFIGGVMPSDTSPLVIDVTDSGAVDLTPPVITNAKQFVPWIVWNAAEATSLTLRGSNGSGYIEGSILAPNADVHFASGYIEGQIAAKSFTITSGGEIHHIASSFRLPESETASGSWSTTDPTCAPGPVGGSLTVDSVPGIVYTWTTAPSGSAAGDTFTSWSGSNLPAGTLAFDVDGTDGVTAVGALTFTHTFGSPPESCVTAEVPPAPSANDQCGTNGDTFTVPAVGDHFTWSVADGRVDGVGSVTISAMPNDGWTFPGGTQTVWSFPFTDAACPPEVVTISVAPTASDVCGVVNDTLTIPTPGVNDHYSFTRSGPSGAPGSATGSVTVTATADAGYSFGSAQSQWVFEFTDAECAPTVTTISVAPTASDVCGVANDTLTIPTPGVGDHYSFARTGPAGAPGSATGTVTVTATADAGYSFGSAQSQWVFEFTDVECAPTVTTISVAPTASDVCGVVNDTLTIPTPGMNDHYSFSRSGPSGAPGSATGSVTVTATADAGYSFGSAQSQWTFGFTDVACPPELETISTAPTAADECGVANDTLSIPTPGVNDHYSFSRSGPSGAPGSATGSVTVTATADAGYTFGSAQSQWTFEFTDVACPPVQIPAPSAPDFDDACGIAEDMVRMPAAADDRVTYVLDDARDGDGVGRVTITAEPEAGTAFPADAERVWWHDFTAEDCSVVRVLQTDPEASSCTNRAKSAFPAWIRIVPAEHVDYRIDGIITTTEYTQVTAGDHVVTATAHDGYILGAANPDPDEWTDTEHTWRFTAFDTSLCPTPFASPPLYSANASATDQECAAGRLAAGTISVSLPTTDPTAVRYRLADGTELTAGTTIMAPGQYVVTATPRDSGAELEGASSWTLDIVTAGAACAHPAASGLQQTGSGPIAPAALLALALGIAGIGMLALVGMRRRRA